MHPVILGDVSMSNDTQFIAVESLAKIKH